MKLAVCLKLTLKRAIKACPSADQLPIILKIITADDVKAQKPMAGAIGVASEICLAQDEALSQAYDWQSEQLGQTLAKCMQSVASPSHLIAQSMVLPNRPFVALTANEVLTQAPSVPLLAWCDVMASHFCHIKAYLWHHNSQSHSSANHAKAQQQGRFFDACQSNFNQSILKLGCDITTYQASQAFFAIYQSKSKEAFAVPCRFYPIAKITQNKDGVQRQCRMRPASNALPQTLSRKRSISSSKALPLHIRCWHDAPPPIVPAFRSYLMQHFIHASLDGISLHPMSVTIKTDTVSFCWSAQIEITQSDFVRIQDKIQASNAQAPTLTIAINQINFSILCEQITHNQSFMHKSVSLSGRSITALLSSDYAYAKAMMDVDLYASQLALAQLENTKIGIDNFAITDWLIPKNSYTGNGKTPIGVITDIAKACGGFVYSHPSEGKLSLLPRYKVPAWEVGGAKADKIISLEAIIKMTKTRHVKPRFNSVTVVGLQQAGIVYRQNQAGDKDAPVFDNPLIGDKQCIINAGIAVLSDSGIHNHINLELPLSNQYALHLAQLGDIWQVNDEINGKLAPFRAVVVSVAIDAQMADDVPIIRQTVGLDAYLDE